ncbi:MAG: ABC-F family ATP-binding cassette domain-containing protein [Flavobacteriales bacterium]
MIALDNVTVRVNGIPLLDQVSFMVERGDRIGLTGKNGSGKSTLLRAVLGEVVPDEGRIGRGRDLRVGLLAQEMEQKEGRSVKEESRTAFGEFQRLEKKREELQKRMSEHSDPSSEDFMEIAQEAYDIEERYAMLGGHDQEGELERTLYGLGFESSDLDRPVEEFSGGWRMRIELAKLLLRKPDVLLLDEPTNHLDIHSILWLEEQLRDFQGGLILVSHDRRFLDAVTDRTIEVVNGRVYDHRVPFSEFMEIRRTRIEDQEKAKKDQEKEIARTKQLIEKFKGKPNKASFAKNLQKRLERMEEVEVDEMDSSQLKLRFPPAPHSGKVVLEGEGICKKYGEQEVLKDVDLVLEKGEKVAFVGRNGEGKSTLAKLITGQEDHEGVLKLGHQVKVGYYAQERTGTLEADKTVYEAVEASATDATRPYLRDILGAFLFSGETINKRIRVLSGGERARVALCKLMMEPANLLVLDEPTNHLDMASKEILKGALKHYDGSLIIISHDRELMAGLTEKVYEFRNKGIKEHHGDIDRFLEDKRIEDMQQWEGGVGEKAASPKSEKKAEKPKGKVQKEKQKALQKAKREAQKLEEQIDKEERRIAELEEKMNKVYQGEETDGDGIFEEHRKARSNLEQLMEKWERTQKELDERNS